jgi:hypothetical protein
LVGAYGIRHLFLASSYGSLHFDLHPFLIVIYGSLSIVMCRLVHTTNKMGFSSDYWIY